MFRFSIRELLWLSVIVGLAICWWRDHSAYNDLQVQFSHVRFHRDYLRQTLDQERQSRISQLKSEMDQLRARYLIEIQGRSRASTHPLKIRDISEQIGPIPLPEIAQPQPFQRLKSLHLLLRPASKSPPAPSSR